MYEEIFFVFLLLFTSGFTSYSQSYNTQRNQIFFYNIGLNGLIGGIGGAINKNEGESLLKAFGKNFLIGSLGGVIKYSAKSELFFFNEKSNVPLIKLNRLYYYLGHSFVKNASLNKPLFSNYNLNMYGIELDFNKKNEKFNVDARVSLSTINSVFKFWVLSGYQLDLQKSLDYGLFYFTFTPDPLSVYQGYSWYNAIAIGKVPLSTTPPHELAHSYQFSDYLMISSFFNTSFSKIKNKKIYTKLQKYVYLDIPYFNYLYYLNYLYIHKQFNNANFYEFEANHFVTRKFIER